MKEQCYNDDIHFGDLEPDFFNYATVLFRDNSLGFICAGSILPGCEVPTTTKVVHLLRNNLASVHLVQVSPRPHQQLLRHGNRGPTRAEGLHRHSNGWREARTLYGRYLRPDQGCERHLHVREFRYCEPGHSLQVRSEQCEVNLSARTSTHDSSIRTLRYYAVCHSGYGL